MFEEFVGKRVRITKTDGFVKYGLLLTVESNFLKIQWDHSAIVEYIALSLVAGIVENARGGRA